MVETDLRKKVEAVLFTTGKFLDSEEIARLCDLDSVGFVRDALEELKEDYEKRDTALNIINQGNKWKLTIRKDYLFLTEKLLTDCELDRPTQETLAVIAYKTPVLQSEIIKIRGNGAYEHIARLKEYDFVTSEKYSRTKILRATQKFYDYFDIVEDHLKEKMGQKQDETQEA